MLVHSPISALAQAWPRQGTENSLMYRPHDGSQTSYLCGEQFRDLSFPGLMNAIHSLTVDTLGGRMGAASGAHRILTLAEQEPNGTKSRTRWLGRRSVSLCLTSSGSFSGLAESWE